MLSFSFWNGRSVFVTGGTGFLGSWLVDHLLELGAAVVSLVRDIPANPWFSSGTISRRPLYVVGQLEDQPSLERIINEHEVETVFHLGAQAIVGTATRSPLATFEANIRGSYNLLESCRRVATVERVVVASSDKAYGPATTLPYDESMPLCGCHPYDVSKSCTDLLTHTYHHTYRLPACVTRCGNFFGGRDLNLNRIIPGTICSVLASRRPVIRSDGKFVRDYIYVRDIVSAYLLLAQCMDDAALHGQAFNFGLETPVTVCELTNKILVLMKREDLQPEVLNQAGNEIRSQWLSAAKARRLLGWQPCFTLETALAETIAWYRDHMKTSALRSGCLDTQTLRSAEDQPA